MDKYVLSALIGLAGAIGNNGKTETTDAVVRKGLLSDGVHDDIDAIHKEKYKISPNCENCQSPCGNTSDYPIEKYEEWSDAQRKVKEKVLAELKRLASEMPEDKELPDLVYKAISYVGYDLQETTYINLCEELKVW